MSGLWEGSPHLDQVQEVKSQNARETSSAPKSENLSPSTPHPSPSLPLPPPTASRSEGPEQSLPGSFRPPPPTPDPRWGGGAARAAKTQEQDSVSQRSFMHLSFTQARPLVVHSCSTERGQGLAAACWADEGGGPPRTPGATSAEQPEVLQAPSGQPGL